MYEIFPGKKHLWIYFSGPKLYIWQQIVPLNDLNLIFFSVFRTGVTEPMIFFGMVYAMTKSLELIDTVFLVLKKRPVIFLHWWDFETFVEKKLKCKLNWKKCMNFALWRIHHLSMLWVTNIMATEEESLGRFFLLLNTAVHSIMYAYFGLMVSVFLKSRENSDLQKFYAKMMFQFYRQWDSNWENLLPL